jgi:eukaryotic-like serine/threonine-protein kinase
MASSAHMETERQPGAIIGPYRLVEPLGEGGMGEVWKAADTRLGRTVAIKFAKSQFTERSEREARAVAALNHRHIATLYDVGPDYLVMEYVEGTPIKGPLPAAKAVALTGQICEALAAAHREGIVHRDLKPANILLTRQGVKLLDFGVAKFDAAREAASGADAETITGEHVFVGTPNYMAPEQLENHTADARSDIFALGCVVYELLAGERAFEGKSVASVASAVLSTEPAPLAERQPLTPPAVEAVLRKCLAKDPEERWQAALDVKFAFEQALAAPAAAGAKPRPWLWAGVGALAAAALAAAGFWLLPQEEQPLYQFELDAPGGLRIAQHSLSPDGRRIAFIGASDNAPNQVWLRALDSNTAVPLPGTEEARSVHWSPNSRAVAFTLPGALMRQSLGIASPPTKICDLPQGFVGVMWVDAETMLLSMDGKLQRVAASGGAPAPLWPDAAERYALLVSPGMLATGKHFFASTGGGGGPPALGVFSVDGATRKMLELSLPQGGPMRYVRPTGGRPGYLLINSQGTLYAQAFDESSLSLEGTPQTLADGLAAGTGGLSASQTGTLAYPLPDPLRLAWLDFATGRMEDLGEEGPRRAFQLSPKGDRIYFAARRQGQQGIWAMDARRQAAATLVVSMNNTPRNFALSRDGAKLLYVERGEGNGAAVKEAPVSGGAPKTLVALGPFMGDPLDWSANGEYALLGSRGGNALLKLSEGEKPQLLRAGAAHASFSPDGRWISWFSQDSGRAELFVQAAAAGAQPAAVSPEDTRFPRWRADGQALYAVRDGRLVEIPLRFQGETIAGGEPVAVSATPLALSSPSFADSARYHVAAGGKRALVLTSAFSHSREGLQVILNWPRILRRP